MHNKAHVGAARAWAALCTAYMHDITQAPFGKGVGGAIHRAGCRANVAGYDIIHLCVQRGLLLCRGECPRRARARLLAEREAQLARGPQTLR